MVPVEKSDNSASGKHLCVSKYLFESLWTSAARGNTSHEPGFDLSRHSSDSDHREAICFSDHACTQGQEGVPCPGGRTASDRRQLPHQRVRAANFMLLEKI